MKSVSHEDLYPLVQWVDDFFDLVSQSGGKTEEELPEVVDDLFYRNHPDDPKAEARKACLVAAYNYMVRNQESLNAGVAAVFGKDRSLITQDLAVALYRVFILLPPTRYKEEIDPDYILKLAKEQKDRNESH